MNWTEAADQLLITLWGKGLTLTEVAAGMGEQGYAVERNAIAGRKHRLAKQGVEFDLRPKDPPKERVRKIRSTPMIRIVKEGKPIAHFDGVDYLKNGPEGCKAILDKIGRDGLRMCCGRQRVSFRPYCEDHLQVYCNIEKGK